MATPANPKAAPPVIKAPIPPRRRIPLRINPPNSFSGLNMIGFLCVEMLGKVA
jgi:hypothetical protein